MARSRSELQCLIMRLGSVGALALVPLVLVVACGSPGERTALKKAAAPKSTAPASSTSTTLGMAAGTLSISPPSGPAGMSFTLTASRFPPGETVRFEINGPKDKTFTGPPHQVESNGTVSATYRTADDPPGEYTVKAKGDKGSSAEGSFQVTGGTTTSEGSSTTVHSSTTTTGPRP